MRLESIEIRGFKSFANPTQIFFNENITGVVGPNGSGKSNIIDAIRWVLGEQKTRELRLDSMSDVLFNGTKHRRASNSAQVTIHFDNSKKLLAMEYAHVAISRTLYRSGDSEYRINDVVCRLKDIRNLFLDSGIGSNSYAIIALGMVDEILADRDGARRAMFEQAAGISKYKQHKKETILKLKQTTEDLERLEDILFEIEKNLSLLEKQAKRAAKYLKIKEEYRTLAIAGARFQLRRYADRLRKLLDRMDAEKDKSSHFSSKIAEIEAVLARKKKSLLDVEKELSDEQRQLNGLISDIRKTEEDRRVLKQKMEFIEQNKQSNEQQLGTLENKLVEISSAKSLAEERCSELKTLGDELREEFEKLEETVADFKKRHTDAQQLVDSLSAKYKDVETELLRLERDLAVGNSKEESLQTQLQHIRAERDKRISLGQELELRIKKAESEEATISSTILQLENSLAAVEKEKESIDTKMKGIDVRIHAASRQLDSKEHEGKLLQEMIQKMEGFPESSKYLWSNRAKWSKGAPVLFSDILQVDSGYAKVMEIFFREYLDYIVVDTEEDALNAMDLLTEAQKGRTGFFIRSSFPKEEHKAADSLTFQRAIDVVSCQERDKPLLHWLLRGVYILDESADLVSLEQGADAYRALIAPDGRMVRTPHLWHGGSVGILDGKKIGRVKAVEEIAEEVKKYREELSAAEGDKAELVLQRERLEDVKLIRKNVVELNTKRSRLDQQLAGLKVERKGAKEQATALDHNEAQIIASLAQLREDMKEKEASQKQQKRAFEKIKEESDEHSYQFATVSAEYAQLREHYNEKKILLIQKENAYQNASQEVSHVVDQQSDVMARISDLRTRLSSYDTDNRDLLGEIGELEKSNNELKEKRAVFEKRLSGKEKDYYSARGEIGELEDQIRNYQRNVNACQQLLAQIKEKHTEVRLERNSVLERLKVEFNIDPESLTEGAGDEDAGTDEFAEEELMQRVKSLRDRLYNFGEVNPLAVEAYEEMVARHKNIIEQRDDVLHAKEILLDTIQEIEETAVNRYLETFAHVKENFQKVFRTLFTEEDDCDLILVDPEDPLSSAIEIVAKPKGKRPKTLAQLSGGEKTLTAIALLFALYLHKPAPFCIFDEVDAPLDDTNIEKFNKIIRQFSEQSQFIIVTHNKLTMAAVDVIYGVYMEKTGISNVSAVDFRHLDHQLEFAAV